jgi:hypothetical protein
MIDVLGVIMVLFDYLEDVLVLEDTCWRCSGYRDAKKMAEV